MTAEWVVPYTNFQAQYYESRRSTLAVVDSVFRKGDFIMGRGVERFERRFAKLCGVRSAVAVANGTDALILAFRALGIRPGDELITAPNSFVASAGAIAAVGAKPVFVDVRHDLNLDASQIERAITRRTKAIVPVHLAGRMADMDAINKIARKRGLWVIEDAAQSAGAQYKGKSSGALGDIGCFSLHPLKNLNAAGDAGILTSNNATLERKLRLLRNHGLKNRDEVECWGFNSRLDTIQAGILNLRLGRLSHVIANRRRIASQYFHELNNVVQCPLETPDAFHTYHLFVIRTTVRDALRNYLTKHGIETKVHYPIPIHLQPAARALGYKRGSFPVCEELANTMISLPIHQYLNDRQVNYVIDTIRGFYIGKRNR